MEGKDNIKELFSQKLGNYEAKVNPELWAKISSQVAAGATTTVAVGLSIVAKIAIGIGISAAVITTVVLLNTNSREEAVSTQAKVDVKKVSLESLEGKENSAQDSNAIPRVLSRTKENNGTHNITEPSKVEPLQGKSTFIKVDALPVRDAKSVGSKSTDPTVVQGVTYVEVTKYGNAKEVVRLPEVTQEVVGPNKAFKKLVNVFTPNGDKANNEFFLESEGLTGFSIVVMNANGDVVYQSEDPLFRWDGRDRRTGEIVPAGSYMYMVSAEDSNGKPAPVYERLTIIH